MVSGFLFVLRLAILGHGGVARDLTHCLSCFSRRCGDFSQVNYLVIIAWERILVKHIFILVS